MLLTSHGSCQAGTAKAPRVREGDADVNIRNDRAQGACRIEAAGPGLLVSRWFWSGGALSIAAWAWLLGKIGS